jgi:hypothetical protein
VTARRGRLKSAIHCAAHGLTYGFDGRLIAGATPGDLTVLEMTRQGRLVLVRAGGAAAARPAEPAWDACAVLLPRAVADVDVAADWKVIVEQWLESPQSQQHFVAPNQLLQIRPAGASILQVVPTAPGRCRIRRFDFSAAQRAPRGSRETDGALRAQIELAESTQSGLMGAAPDQPDATPATPALARFRESIAVLLPAR